MCWSASYPGALADEDGPSTEALASHRLHDKKAFSQAVGAGMRRHRACDGGEGRGEIEMDLLSEGETLFLQEQDAIPSVFAGEDSGGNTMKLSRPHRTPFFALLRALSPWQLLRPLWRWVPRQPSAAADSLASNEHQRSSQCSNDNRCNYSDFTTVASRPPTTTDGSTSDTVSADGPASDAAFETKQHRKHSASAKAPGTEEQEAIVERYNNVLGDKQWFYAEIASFGCSLLVGAMEGVPAARCRPRAVVALLAATLQCGLSLTTVVPLELALQSLLGLCIVPLSIVVTAKVFSADADDPDGGVDAAIDVLSLVGNIIGIGLMAVGVVGGAVEMFTSYRLRDCNHRDCNSQSATGAPPFDHVGSTHRMSEAVSEEDDNRGAVPLASLHFVGPTDSADNSDP